MLNITSIPAYWLTCEKSKDRWKDMNISLDKAGISAVQLNGELTNPYTIGVAKGHLDAISRHKKGPVLILEDDARITKYYTETIDIDLSNVDAIYLGSSYFGRVDRVTHLGGIKVQPYSNNFFRCLNMLSMHAIIYNSENYINHITKLLNIFIKHPQGGVDDLIADTMSIFNVLVVKKPFFYQDDGHSELATLTPLQE